MHAYAKPEIKCVRIALFYVHSSLMDHACVQRMVRKTMQSQKYAKSARLRCFTWQHNGHIQCQANISARPSMEADTPAKSKRTHRHSNARASIYELYSCALHSLNISTITRTMRFALLHTVCYCFVVTMRQCYSYAPAIAAALRAVNWISE